MASVFDLLYTPERAMINKIKAELLLAIVHEYRRRQLSQQKLAVMLGISQPRVSNLLCGKLAKFSIESLMCYRVRMGGVVVSRFQVKSNLAHNRIDFVD